MKNMLAVQGAMIVALRASRESGPTDLCCVAERRQNVVGDNVTASRVSST
jgi:hypothetical protein